MSANAAATRADAFARTPAWPKTQRTTPETTAAARRARATGFMYLRDEDEDADAATPASRRRAPAGRRGPSARATTTAQSPFAIVRRHAAGSATPYANLDAPAPDSVTLTTASGKSVVARANGSIRTDEQPRFDDDDEAYEDAFTFRAAIETPATTRAESGGAFASAAPKGLVFQTGGGASIAVSEDAKRRARAMFADVDENGPSSSGRERPSATTSGGLVFQTAAGATLELSEAALKKSRAFLAEVGNEKHASACGVPAAVVQDAEVAPGGSQGDFESARFHAADEDNDGFHAADVKTRREDGGERAASSEETSPRWHRCVRGCCRARLIRRARSHGHESAALHVLQ